MTTTKLKPHHLFCSKCRKYWDTQKYPHCPCTPLKKPPRRKRKTGKPRKPLTAKQLRALETLQNDSRTLQDEMETLLKQEECRAEVRKFISANPDGILGFDAKLAAGLMCFALGDGIVCNVGTMMLAEHFSERIPAFIKAAEKKEKGT